MDENPAGAAQLTGPAVAIEHRMTQELCRALVVEDDRAIASLFEMILRREHFEADTAGNGNQALEKTASNGYHLMIIDLMLPQTNGRRVIEYMLQRVVLSGLLNFG